VAHYEVTLVARTPASSGTPTLEEVCGLKWSALAYEDEAGAPGRIDVGAPVRHLATAAKTRLRDLIAAPCELWIHRDGTRVAAGPLTSWTIQNQTITLYAPGLLGYLRYWLWDADQTFTAQDQATIVATLINTMQARTYGSFGLDTAGLTPTGVTRDLTLRAAEPRNLGDVIPQMGERDNGFELSIDPTSRRITMHTPRQGNDLSELIFFDRRNVGSAQVFASVAPGQIATDVVGTSSSTAAGTALTSAAANTAERATFGRAQLAQSWSDIRVQATLDDHTRRLADDYAAMRLSVSPQLIPVAGADVTDFDVGDQVTYSFDAGLGEITSVERVRTKQVSVSGGRAKEQLAVRFT
jgi:hypothetical protein